jgi:hypothetical protein
MSANPVTAQTVRQWILANPKRQEGLSEQALANLTSRGRLHAENVKRFNSKRAKTRRYVEGGTKAAKAVTNAQRAALREQGVNVGLRGPLSKEATKALRALKV